MAVSRKAMTEGIRTKHFDNPSVSCADSSLYTREPGVLPHQCVIRWFSEEYGNSLFIENRDCLLAVPERRSIYRFRRSRAR